MRIGVASLLWRNQQRRTRSCRWARPYRPRRGSEAEDPEQQGNNNANTESFRSHVCSVSWPIDRGVVLAHCFLVGHMCIYTHSQNRCDVSNTATRCWAHATCRDLPTCFVHCNHWVGSFKSPNWSFSLVAPFTASRLVPRLLCLSASFLSCAVLHTRYWFPLHLVRLIRYDLIVSAKDSINRRAHKYTHPPLEYTRNISE